MFTVLVTIFFLLAADLIYIFIPFTQCNDAVYMYQLKARFYTRNVQDLLK